MSLVSGHPLALGPLSSDRFILDPKTFSFFLSRYKFAGKMLSRCRRIADIGCGDGTGDVMLLKETDANILAYDLDKEQIEYANKTLLPVLHKVIPHDANRLAVEQLDFIIDGPLCPSVDGLVSLDVIEHISPDDEDIFLRYCIDSLEDKGVCIIGTPNDYASNYASKFSKAGHINMFTPNRLENTMASYFSRVFMFSMNDEVVHTGFSKMAHYLIAIGIK